MEGSVIMLHWLVQPQKNTWQPEPVDMEKVRRSCTHIPHAPQQNICVVYDIDKAPIELKEIAIDSMHRYGYSILNSDFHKWFEKEFSNRYYYETITGALGQINQIKIFEKGCIEININEDYKSDLRFSKFISDDFEVGEVLKKVGQAIIEYPFFTETEGGNLNFLKLNDNNDMTLII